MVIPLIEPVPNGCLLDRVRLRRRARGVIAPVVCALGCALASGCARESLPCLLDLDEGDLVITEIRGPQQGVDTRGEWFELLNTTDQALDLQGLRGVLINLKGSLEVSFIVRDSLSVEPGGYVVLGSLANPPIEVDYSFNADFAVVPSIEDSDGTLVIPQDEDRDPRELFANARVELWTCEQLIDSVVYAELPPMGTYSYDGAQAPDAEGNDDPLRWCTNATEPPDGGPQTELGLPGSPGEANPPCP